jgi:hypothetical protein
MMEAVRTSETSVNNHFTQQYIPEDNSEHGICVADPESILCYQTRKQGLGFRKTAIAFTHKACWIQRQTHIFRSKCDEMKNFQKKKKC